MVTYCLVDHLDAALKYCLLDNITFLSTIFFIKLNDRKKYLATRSTTMCFQSLFVYVHGHIKMSASFITFLKGRTTNTSGVTAQYSTISWPQAKSCNCFAPQYSYIPRLYYFWRYGVKTDPRCIHFFYFSIFILCTEG